MPSDTEALLQDLRQFFHRLSLDPPRDPQRPIMQQPQVGNENARAVEMPPPRTLALHQPVAAPMVKNVGVCHNLTGHFDTLRPTFQSLVKLADCLR